VATIEAPRAANGAPPHSIEAEQSVLGAVLLTDRTLYGLVIEDGLRADDFYREQHRLIYEAMLGLYGRSEPVDVLTVTEALRQSGRLEDAGGEAAVHGLAGAVPAAGNVRHYAKIVKENALLRRLMTTTFEIQASVANREAAPRELIEHAERAMLEVARDDRQKDFRNVGDILHHEIEVWQRLATEGTSLYRTCCTSNTMSSASLGAIATPAVQLDGTSNPPSSANRPAYLSSAPMTIRLWYDAPTENTFDHCPR
jgi:replicative DNA helicase